MRMDLRMKGQIFVLAAEIPCEWMFATKFASDCECDGVVHSDIRYTPLIWGGGYGPDRLLAASPGKRPREILMMYSASFRFFCVFGCVCSSLRSLCIMYNKMVCYRQRPAKSRAHNPQGLRLFSVFVLLQLS